MPPTKKYDLEERTEKFARNVSLFIESLPRTISNTEYGRQLVRSSASIGANYLEANAALSKPDFVMRIKICRKEAKETCFWIRLIQCSGSLQERKDQLFQEALELTKIFGSIVVKTTWRYLFHRLSFTVWRVWWFGYYLWFVYWNLEFFSALPWIVTSFRSLL